MPPPSKATTTRIKRPIKKIASGPAEIDVPAPAPAPAPVDLPPGVVGNAPLGLRSVADDPAATLLHISEDFDDERLVVQLMLQDFRQMFPTLGEDEERFAWIGRVDYHPRALNVCVATSANVPPGVLSGLAAVVRVLGFPVARSVGSTRGLSPLLYVGAEGIKLLRMF